MLQKRGCNVKHPRFDLLSNTLINFDNYDECSFDQAKSGFYY